LLEKVGVLNPTLNVDTGLFIDPLLLEHNQHQEIAEGARNTYRHHFTTVIKLLRATRIQGDVPWRSALRYLSFPEIKWTCLGYGAQSVSGSGSGGGMTSQVIQTAKEIVDLGVEDPDLFVAMALFEEGFGPDRISDMTANVILDDLLRFNTRVLDELPVSREKVTLRLRNGKTYHVALPINPFVKGGVSVILVPSDILRDLPVAADWSDVADAASKNEDLRSRGCGPSPGDRRSAGLAAGSLGPICSGPGGHAAGTGVARRWVRLADRGTGPDHTNWPRHGRTAGGVCPV
jgi:hypothetical protein